MVTCSTTSLLDQSSFIPDQLEYRKADKPTGEHKQQESSTPILNLPAANLSETARFSEQQFSTTAMLWGKFNNKPQEHDPRNSAEQRTQWKNVTGQF